MKVESDALAELESRFTAEDAELFRMFAERTLPELSGNAADATDGARSACCAMSLWHVDMLAVGSYLKRASCDVSYHASCHQVMHYPPTVSVAGCNGACRLQQAILATCHAKLHSARCTWQ